MSHTKERRIINKNMMEKLVLMKLKHGEEAADETHLLYPISPN